MRLVLTLTAIFYFACGDVRPDLDATRYTQPEVGGVSSGKCPGDSDPKTFLWTDGSSVTVQLDLEGGLLVVHVTGFSLKPGAAMHFTIDLDGDGMPEAYVAGAVDQDGSYIRSGRLPTCAGNLKGASVSAT